MFGYLKWHYGRALIEGWEVLINFTVFIFHYFSISLLFRTFFLRISRMGERYGQGFNIEKFFSTLIVNLIMRIVGMVVRTILIVIGLAATILMFLLGLFLYIVWLFLPLVIILSFIKGLLIVI